MRIDMVSIPIYTSVNLTYVRKEGVFVMPTFETTYAMVDAYNRATSKRLDLVAADVGAAITLAGDVAADLAGVSGARILSYTVKVRTVYNDVVTAGSNKDEGATISVRTADNERAIFTIPAPEATIFNADGSVDLVDAAFAAFSANYVNGDILVDDGEVVTEIISGRLDD